jgi:phage-related baseplate assembly protein
MATDPSAPDYGVGLVPDIDFAVKDPTVIESEVILDYQAAFLTLTGIIKTLAPGDPVRLHLLVVCHWLSHQRVLIDFTGKMNLLKYAHDDYLDNLAALYGDRALRLPPAPALCTLRFTLAATLAFSATIVAGTQVQAANVIFQTATDATIPPGQLSVDVAAEAILAGTIGNGFAPGQVNQIINWNQPFGMSVENTDTTSGGSDEESDDQYRYRVWLAIESFSTCGPRDAYEFWALSADPSILQAVVYSAPQIAGEVHIYPLMIGTDGTPQPATTEICNKVLAICNDKDKRPVTDYVTVIPPTVVPFTLNMDYWVSNDNEVLLGTIQSNVEQAVADWILWQKSRVARDLNGDELRKRCLEAGAKRIRINTPTPDFQIMAYNQLAVVSAPTPPNYAGMEDP